MVCNLDVMSQGMNLLCVPVAVLTPVDQSAMFRTVTAAAKIMPLHPVIVKIKYGF